jgi:hypothetical protein
MSKRRANCEHTSWDINGPQITCRDCGETIDQGEVISWLDHDDVIEITCKPVPPQPLTYQIKELDFTREAKHG